MLCFGLHRKIDLLTAKVADLRSEVESLTKSMEIKMAALDDAIAKLQADVTAEGVAIGSVVTFLQSLQAQVTTLTQELSAAGVSDAQLSGLSALAATIEQQTAQLQGLVPASPAPGP